MVDLIGRAGRDLAQLIRIDPEMAPQEQSLVEALASVEEVSQGLRAYSEAVELAPERLEEVEERLDLLRNLQRKYGATVEEVLAFGARAGAELDGLVNREARAAALEARVAALEGEIGAAAGCALGRARGRRASAWRAPSAASWRPCACAARSRSPCCTARTPGASRSAGGAWRSTRAGWTRWSSASPRTPASRPSRWPAPPQAASCPASCWP